MYLLKILGFAAKNRVGNDPVVLLSSWSKLALKSLKVSPKTPSVVTTTCLLNIECNFEDQMFSLAKFNLFLDVQGQCTLIKITVNVPLLAKWLIFDFGPWSRC